MFTSGQKLEEIRRRALVRQLQAHGIRDARVLAVLAGTPRERFVSVELANLAYADRALPIDCDQTISQPYIVALMTEALELRGNERVLEIGTGSGYQTCVLAQLALQIVTIERHALLQQKAQACLDVLGHRNITFVLGDGTQGWADLATFDRIMVTAAAEHLPQALVDQLAEGGILVIPLGGRQGQILQVFRKKGGQLENRVLTACRFVPLVNSPD